MEVDRDTPLQEFLYDRTEKALFERFRIGDIVQMLGGQCAGDVGIVVRKHLEYGEIRCVDILTATGPAYLILHNYRMKDVAVLHFHSFPVIEAIQKRVAEANISYPDVLDNLTYVEIMQRLKQYEHRA